MKLKIKHLIVLCVASLSLLISSCSHQAGEDDPTLNLGTSKYASAQEFLADNAPQPEVLSLDADKGGSMITKNGISFSFAPNSFVQNATPITGMVDVEILEVLNPADMMYTGATTTTANLTLESGGMFHIGVKQNGKPVNLAPGKRYQVTIPAPNGLDFEMQVFQGWNAGGEGSDVIQWGATQDSTNTGWRTDSTQRSYVLDLDFLNWCNLDKYRNDPNQTKVSVKLPTGFTNKNTSVFMVFKKNMVTPLFGDQAKEEFNTGGYTAPMGIDVTFVVISVKDKKTYYALVDTKLVKDHVEIIDPLTEISEDDLKKILQGLKS